MYVCEQNECTACGACAQICPKNCIDFEWDITGMCSAKIDNQKCILCKCCKSVCPILNESTAYHTSKCYAAWSFDNKIRKESASGGVATEIYRYASHKGMSFAGVYMNEKFEAVYGLEEKEWWKFQNSKYVYSAMGSLYKKIKKILEDTDREVVFIGLPCHVAGLKNFLQFTGCNCESLFTVDLICHGVTPPEYLKNHIAYIELRKKQKAKRVSFRDPRAYTYTYTFTLSNKKGTFYKKRVYRNDCYQIGYHKGIAYRNNCYNCKFTKKERVGDITLSDFAGVGSKSPCSYDNKNVSCILINTDKGMSMVRDLADAYYIFIEERPLEEEYFSEARLHSPTPIPKERKIFLDEYRKRQDFEKAMRFAAKNIIIKNELHHFFQVDKVKGQIVRMLPLPVKKKLKKVINRG